MTRHGIGGPTRRRCWRIWRPPRSRAVGSRVRRSAWGGAGGWTSPPTTRSARAARPRACSRGRRGTVLVRAGPHPRARSLLGCARRKGRRRSACGTGCARRAPRAARAGVPLCLTPAGVGRAAAADRHGPHPSDVQAPLARWDDGRGVRPGDVSRPAGRARAAPACQSGALLWRARGPLGLARGRGRSPSSCTADSGGSETACVDDATPAEPGRVRNPSWATLMRRGFGFDVLSCPRCAGRLRLVALIIQAAVIDRILRHLGEPLKIPRPRPARAPPEAPRFAEFTE